MCIHQVLTTVFKHHLGELGFGRQTCDKRPTKKGATDPVEYRVYLDCRLRREGRRVLGAFALRRLTLRDP